MLKQDVAQAVLAEALKTGGDFAEIFLEDRLNNGISMLSGKVSPNTRTRRRPRRPTGTANKEVIEWMGKHTR